MAKGWREARPQDELILQPIADGGNGTLDAWMAQGGTRFRVAVHDPLLRPIEAEYGMLPDGMTAVIEMALASGLELLDASELDAQRASTYGTGELLRHALEQGARRLIIGMGGSATVDGGAGALQALGVRLLDAQGAELAAGGAALANLAQIDASGLDRRWQECEIIIASDVENPLLGEQGAAAVFGPQKGATAADVRVLEAALTRFADVVQAQHGVMLHDRSGGGAAGGLSAGLLAFLGGRIQSGIDLLLEFTRFEELLRGADLVLTGEGQMDEQTISGKGPIGVARLARQHGVATIALVGGLNVHDRVLHAEGIAAAFALVDRPMALAEALARAAELLERATLRVAYVVDVVGRVSP
jgi:glycerate kinase